MMKIELTKVTVWLIIACVFLAIASVFVWGGKWLEYAVAASFASMSYGIANNEKIQELEKRVKELEGEHDD